MADKEVFEVNDNEPELIEQKKKGRKPMSEARKAQLREQLKKAREAKKKAKEERKAQGLPEPVKDPTKSKVIKVLDQVGGDPVAEPLPPVYVKAMKKNQSKEIDFLKLEIAELKKGGTTKEDMKMIKELKEELKELRDVAKQYKEQQNKLKKIKESKEEKVEKVEEVEEQKQPVAQPINIPKPVPRYSTYKKSIWSQFT
jgi:DNA repair exonuclease SbcCD ATPase subunit